MFKVGDEIIVVDENDNSGTTGYKGVIINEENNNYWTVRFDEWYNGHGDGYRNWNISGEELMLLKDYVPPKVSKRPKPKIRFKTEMDMAQEYGEHWRKKNYWQSSMDRLHGKYLNGEQYDEAYRLMIKGKPFARGWFFRRSEYGGEENRSHDIAYTSLEFVYDAKREEPPKHTCSYCFKGITKRQHIKNKGLCNGHVWSLSSKVLTKV
jgi:hypothetical protein